MIKRIVFIATLVQIFAGCASNSFQRREVTSSSVTPDFQRTRDWLSEIKLVDSQDNKSEYLLTRTVHDMRTENHQSDDFDGLYQLSQPLTKETHSNLICNIQSIKENHNPKETGGEIDTQPSLVCREAAGEPFRLRITRKMGILGRYSAAAETEQLDSSTEFNISINEAKSKKAKILYGRATPSVDLFTDNFQYKKPGNEKKEIVENYLPQHLWRRDHYHHPYPTGQTLVNLGRRNATLVINDVRLNFLTDLEFEVLFGLGDAEVEIKPFGQHALGGDDSSTIYFRYDNTDEYEIRVASSGRMVGEGDPRVKLSIPKGFISENEKTKSTVGPIAMKTVIRCRQENCELELSSNAVEKTNGKAFMEKPLSLKYKHNQAHAGTLGILIMGSEPSETHIYKVNVKSL